MTDLNISLPPGFTDEEIRCGFRVSGKRKEVWAVELDLLNQFIQVCRSSDLKFFADGGTLLGAIRHKGFIPWDDDIDLVMLREDYDRLVRMASRAFSYPYFFQSVKTEKGYFRGHAQLRNSRTTGILKTELERGYGFNQGIFIDIFVLDGVPDDKNRQRRFERRYRRIRKIRDYTPTKYHFLYRSVFALEEACLRKNKVECCDYAAALSFWFDPDRMKINRHIYDDLQWVPFEFMEIPVPTGYDEYLKHQYGDYMTPVQSMSQHGGVLFDTDRPWSEYMVGL